MRIVTSLTVLSAWLYEDYLAERPLNFAKMINDALHSYYLSPRLRIRVLALFVLVFMFLLFVFPASTLPAQATGRYIS